MDRTGWGSHTSNPYVRDGDMRDTLPRTINPRPGCLSSPYWLCKVCEGVGAAVLLSVLLTFPVEQRVGNGHLLSGALHLAVSQCTSQGCCSASPREGRPLSQVLQSAPGAVVTHGVQPRQPQTTRLRVRTELPGSGMLMAGLPHWDRHASTLSSRRSQRGPRSLPLVPCHLRGQHLDLRAEA